MTEASRTQGAAAAGTEWPASAGLGSTVPRGRKRLRPFTPRGGSSAPAAAQCGRAGPAGAEVTLRAAGAAAAAGEKSRSAQHGLCVGLFCFFMQKYIKYVLLNAPQRHISGRLGPSYGTILQSAKTIGSGAQLGRGRSLRIYLWGLQLLSIPFLSDYHEVSSPCQLQSHVLATLLCPKEK